MKVQLTSVYVLGYRAPLFCYLSNGFKIKSLMLWYLRWYSDRWALDTWARLRFFAYNMLNNGRIFIIFGM